MQSLSNLYGIGSCSDSYNYVNGVINSTEMFTIENNSGVSTISYADAKALASNKSHSEAERRRRRRINGHLATLRTLVPNTIKTDKASLLAEVVRCLRELKEKTEELSETTDEYDHHNNDDNNNNNTTTFLKNINLPTETDDLKLCYYNEDQCTIQATICCEDRPTMMVDLTRALNSVQAKILRAEMATIGGRTKNVLWVQIEAAAAALDGSGDEGLGMLRRALKVVMDKSTLLPAAGLGLGQSLPGNKRPRLYHS